MGEGRVLENLFKIEKHYNEVKIHILEYGQILLVTLEVSGRWFLFIHSPDSSGEAVYFLGSVVCDAVRDGNEQAGSPSGSPGSHDEPCLSPH